jgi:hypothetical protein
MIYVYNQGRSRLRVIKLREALLILGLLEGMYDIGHACVNIVVLMIWSLCHETIEKPLCTSCTIPGKSR